MAFRATKTTSKKAVTKPAAKSKSSEETVQEFPVVESPAKEFRIEDLVGAGPTPNVADTAEKAPGFVASITDSETPRVPQAPEQRRWSASDRPAPRSEAPTRGYQPGGYNRRPGGGRFQGRDQRFGNNRNGDRPYTPRYGEQGRSNNFDRGFDRPRQGGGYAPQPRFDRPPMREMNDAAFTPDIDVPTETVRGILDVMTEGHGFLRPKFTPSERDVYISQSQIRRFLLRNGDMVEGQARQPKDNERYWGLLKVEKVNEKTAEEIGERPKFEDLTPIYPNKHIRLETGKIPLSTRIIDLVAPIGFGQRGLIVSPPKAGKTTILKEIAAGITENYPNVHLMAALIGERPEEVTDLSRSIKGEVLASNFDQSPAEQTRVAEVALDRAKRLVEMGHDVVVLLDSITRLARAYNLVVNPSGRTLSGGFDPAALYPAKKFLGAARCVEKKGAIAGAQSAVDEETGGSLTVIGTALVETGSRMDDLIYEEFKGTGNMELHLSRILQERRIFPAIDVGKSGTRHDELLLGVEAMKRVVTLRHMLSLLSDEERTLMLIDRLGKTESNEEFLSSLAIGQ